MSRVRFSRSRSFACPDIVCPDAQPRACLRVFLRVVSRDCSSSPFCTSLDSPRCTSLVDRLYASSRICPKDSSRTRDRISPGDCLRVLGRTLLRTVQTTARDSGHPMNRAPLFASHLTLDRGLSRAFSRTISHALPCVPGTTVSRTFVFESLFAFVLLLSRTPGPLVSCAACNVSRSTVLLTLMFVLSPSADYAVLRACTILPQRTRLPRRLASRSLPSRDFRPCVRSIGLQGVSPLSHVGFLKLSRFSFGISVHPAGSSLVLAIRDTSVSFS